MSASLRVILVAGVALLLVAAVVLYRAGDNNTTSGLAVGWGGSEGNPSCVYDPKGGTVEAKILIEGHAAHPDEVVVTVTAYADENTSQPVGSSTRRVQVEGSVHRRLLVLIPVQGVPHRGEDGESACKLTIDEGDAVIR